VPSIVVLLGRWNWWPSKITIDQAEPPAGPSGPAGNGQSAAGPPAAGRTAPETPATALPDVS
jgi:uncharacterized membrane protein YdfJ with MMPL/SSD domain